MAGRDLKALIAAYRDGDDLSFRRAANAIIEEEEAKRHTALARELRRLLASGTSNEVAMAADPGLPRDAPRDKESDLPLVDLVRPRRGLMSLVLEASLTASLAEIVNEIQRWGELDRAGVPRRRSILLAGPPGCGKTSIAESLATELQRPLAIVRTESVLSSFLGETASNIARVFEYAESNTLVLLFDEFDGIGKSRDDASDHGELRRVVNAVLQLIDRYRGPSLIVAATNHAHILDAALWRRFSEVYEVSLPNRAQRVLLLSRILNGRAAETINLQEAAGRLDGLPHAAVERAAHDALRLAVLDGRKRVHISDVDLAISRTVQRRWL